MERSVERCTRRGFLLGSLVLAGLGLLVGCGAPAPPAPKQAKVPRIGVLSPGPLDGQPLFQAFRDGLREYGYVDGETIAIERRSGEGRDERLPELAAELARLPVDLIVTQGVQAALAAKGATAAVPIVFVRVGDPVGSGLVASLARPGGNVTGFASLQAGLSHKRLDLLKAAFPGVARVAVLWNPSIAPHEPALRELEAAARARRLELLPLPIREPNDYEAAFRDASGAGVDALMPLSGDFLLNANAGRAVEFAAGRRLPGVYPVREYIAANGLMAYLPDEAASHQRAASYVDRILKGAKPADLPVEQPTTFEFVVNLKTARALGLSIPPSVLQQATELIE